MSDGVSLLDEVVEAVGRSAKYRQIAPSLVQALAERAPGGRGATQGCDQDSQEQAAPGGGGLSG